MALSGILTLLLCAVVQSDPDLALQGEYAGKDLGAQVVAQGKGEFAVVFFKGGLPGAGWNGKDRQTGAGTSKDGKLSAEGDGWTAEITPEALVRRDGKGSPCTLKKIERKSPSLGKKPPSGALVLFDGTHTKEWSNGKIVEGNLLQCGPVTKKAFRDFQLHVEFRLPFKPEARGQARGNSGVYLQRRYEVQILDSFGLDPVANGCGGLYRQKPADLNMCFPPCTWQTYDITFKAARFDANGKKTAGARITVLHNGVAIHKDYELTGKTGAGKPEGPMPGPILLQDHSNPVVFRNVWLVESE